MYHLQVVTPERVVFDDQVKALVAPGEEGYLGVLTDHAPLLVALKPGMLKITDKTGEEIFYKNSAGFLEVSHNQASVLIEQASTAWA